MNKSSSYMIGLLLATVMSCYLAVPVCRALPSDRSYEMVSPTFKAGYGALEIEGVSSNGDAAIFYSPGAFAGTPTGGELMGYLAVRQPSGWSTRPLTPPLTVLAYSKQVDVTPSLSLELAMGSTGPNSQALEPEEELFTHVTDQADEPEYWEHIGRLEAIDGNEVGAVYAGATADFCHILFTTESYLFTLTIGTLLQLYEYDLGCNGKQEALRLVGSNNRPTPRPLDGRCMVDLGTASHYAIGGESAFNAVSADGSEVFFTDCVNGTFGPQQPHQVFVRLGGTRTVEVSRPVDPLKPFGGCVGEKIKGEVPCEGASERPSADFAGASEDGKLVYFTTKASLVAADADEGNDLYAAEIDCPQASSECGPAEREVRSLILVSHDPNGPSTEAGVQGVVRIAPDGIRAYFVARGDLLTSVQRERRLQEHAPEPTAGADNLYVYDVKTEATEFVGALCSGSELSGVIEDVQCPNTTEYSDPAKRTDILLWSGARGEPGEVQTAGIDGGFLVFATYAQLTTDDADEAKDVYRYDANTGALGRVSIGEHGYDANGNRNDGNEAGHYVNNELVEGTESVADSTIAPGHLGGSVLLQYEMDNRAVTEDGNSIVFTTAEPLSTRATNGQVNAYEWSVGGGANPEGTVSLISSGNAEGATRQAVVSPTGLSIFFETVQGLVSQDTDGAPDVYDARREGGFAVPPVEREPCEADACQGPLAEPLPALVPGSSLQAPVANRAVKESTGDKRPRVKRRHKRRGKRLRTAGHKKRRKEWHR